MEEMDTKVQNEETLAIVLKKRGLGNLVYPF
jgi:hypothetical protein